MKSILVLTAFLFSFAAMATPLPRGESLQRLFSVTNDHDSRLGRISITIGSDETATGFFLGLNKDGNDVAGDAFALNLVESSDGALLVEEQGHKALFLLGKLDRGTQEGRFQFRYLANGISGKYETCDFLLKHSGTNWFVENAYTGKMVENMKIVTWALGIRNLEGICAR